MGQEALSKIETLKDNNGCVYKGESHHGKAHGNGWMECPDPVNTLYRGEWQFGRFHGKGRYTWENGEYEGDFQVGKMEGKGAMLFERGDLKCYSSGSFHDAKRSGYGFETCINRRHYKGVEAIKQAHEQMEGEYYNFYEGNFHDNQFAGEAICKYEDGRKIRGIFTKGQPSGVAHMKEVDGKEYLMNFIHGAVGGRTLFKKADRVYEFYWKNNKTEGKAASYAQFSSLGDTVELPNNTEFEEFQKEFKFKPKRIKF